MTRTYGLLTVAALAVAGCASSDNMAANSNRSPDTTGMVTPDNPQAAANDKTRITGEISRKDYDFIRDAEAGGLFEVSAGQKAVLKANSADVKSLAQHMVDDHTKLNTELTNLASRKGMPDNAGLTSAQVDMLARLDSLNGADFDRAYLDQQQSAHQDAIAKFQTAASNADDKDVRDWASATLPTLRNHLMMIQTQLRVPDTAGTR